MPLATRLCRTGAATVVTAALVLTPLAAAEAGPRGGHGGQGGHGGRHAPATGATGSTGTSTAGTGTTGSTGATQAGTRGAATSKKVVRDIARRDQKLARIVASASFTSLPEEQQSVLGAAIAADRAALSALSEAVTAGTTTPADARTQLRTLRERNYRVAVKVLRRAEALRVEAADDAEVVALIDQAVAAALGITSASSRDDVRAAKTALKAARELWESRTA